MYRPKPNLGLTDLKPPVDYAPDWTLDLSFEERHPLFATLVSLLNAAVNIAIGLTLGYLIWSV